MEIENQEELISLGELQSKAITKSMRISKNFSKPEWS